MPVTKMLVVLLVFSFLVSIAAQWVMFFLAFIPQSFPQQITGLLTYPLVIHGPGDLINLLFSGLMIWWFGGSLERSWGMRTYLLFLLATNASAALVWQAGFWLFFHEFMPVAGPWLMVSSMVVAWAWLNPEETILLWFVLPVKAKWIGWLTLAMLYFLFPTSYSIPGAYIFLLGFFALGGAGAALAYVRWQKQWGWVPRPARTQRAKRPRVIRHPASTPFGAVLRRWNEWQRRRRIAHLQRTFVLEDDEQGRRG